MPFPTQEIERLIIAGYPILYLISWEEERVEGSLKPIARSLFRDSVRFYTWSCTDGMREEGREIEGTGDVIRALDRLIQEKERAFYLFKDLQFFLNEPRLIRKLKDVYHLLTGSGKTLFILSPSLVLPNELGKEAMVVDIGLPDFDETMSIFDSVINSIFDRSPDSLTPELKEKCIRSLLGLGASEIELALRRSLIGREGIDEGTVDALLEEKAQVIRKSGTLEFIRTRVGLSSIGGLENLKEWLRTRALAFSPRAREFGLDVPKGVLIMGISGCGKSLCAKAVATAWGLPLLRLDLNQVYSGTFGSPEEAFRRAIKTVEAVSPCVLWIDEIEAGITRSGEKTSDSPASRIFGYFLTWMQERNHPVFIAATANQIDLLPPEILRKGRFDEIFFVSLPSQKERKEIFRIHLLNHGKNPDSFDLDSLAKNTEGLSGAEIEQAVVSALFESFSKNKELDNRELIIAASSIVPLSTTMREEISKLERWASNRAVKASK
ncbi:MAG TPA: AAA family ATPase [Thermodesulfobacteriota bacterium]|jgi:AAA+ superfamily predicted ATPase|nr:AAA family ATPase [Thermodesulfobacteriota bacterium]